MEPLPLPLPMPLAPPPPPGTDAFIPYHVPAPGRRPTSVLVLGVLGIVLALLALISALIMLAAFIALRNSPFGAVYVAGTPEERVWQVVQMISNWAFYSALLWAGVGAIRMRPWARKRLVQWACVYLVWLAVETVVVALWVLPAATAFGTPAGAAATPVTPAQRIVPYVMLVLAVVFNATYPILVLAFMRQRHVRAAFDAEAAAVAAAALPMARLAPVAEGVVPLETTGGAG